MFIARSAFWNPATYPRSSPSCPRTPFVMLLQKIKKICAGIEYFWKFNMFRRVAGTVKNSPRISRPRPGSWWSRCYSGVTYTLFSRELALCSIPHSSYTDRLLLLRRVPARNTARLESLATLRAPSFAGPSYYAYKHNCNRRQPTWLHSINPHGFTPSTHMVSLHQILL